MYNYKDDPMLSSLPPWDPGYSFQDQQQAGQDSDLTSSSSDWPEMFVGSISSKKVIYPLNQSDYDRTPEGTGSSDQFFKDTNRKCEKFGLKLKKIREDSAKLFNNQFVKLQGSYSNILSRKQKPKKRRQEKFVKFWLSNAKGQTFRLYSFKEEI